MYIHRNKAMAGKNYTLAFLFVGLHKQYVMSLVMNVSTNGCKRTLQHMYNVHVHVHMHTCTFVYTFKTYKLVVASDHLLIWIVIHFIVKTVE